jgi:hypothetical protein
LVKYQNKTRRETSATALILSLAIILAGCNSPHPGGNRRIEPVYDTETGKLTLLKYDSKGTGRPDTFSYMDGTRVVRIEIDTDGDGKIDRWEYYGADQKLEKIGSSRANDGKPDAWTYTNADGSLARIEVSTKRKGRIDRIEYYERDAMVRAEEDTNQDGKVDKWERYEGARLVSVAFDTTGRGTPDRRLVYTPDGGVRIEVDTGGEGHFVAASDPARASRSRN